ncbi:MAG: glycosyl hydrolase family 38 [Tannerellaceae bacterium]|jgi:hypothetical protein|nr:glycosyl hydrolase family 38 [Tannerellaceae bacterium]
MKKSILLSFFYIFSYICMAQEVTVLQSLPVSAVKVKASSQFAKFKAGNILEDKAFEKNRLVKNNTGENMWISEVSKTPVRATRQSPEGIAWLMFSFDKVYPIEAMHLWNFNQNDHTRRGLNKVYIQYTENGSDWKTLKDGDKDYFFLPESGGYFQQDVDYSLNLKGLKIKGVIITADFKYGNHYHVDNNEIILKEAAVRRQNINYYGLGKIRFYVKGKQKISDLPKIEFLNFVPSQGYLRTPEGPAREFKLDFDKPLYTGGEVIIEQAAGKKKISIPPDPAGVYTLHQTFMPGYMELADDVKITFTSRQGNCSKEMNVPAARKWELYFLPHSHQDIGYTHRQKEVMERQWDNLENAILLAEKTKNYPKEARFRWNTEATWSLYGYLQKYKGTKKAEDIKHAIKEEYIGVDAPLGSILTGISKQEELMHIFDDAQEIEKELNMEFTTAMFSDVPGAVWGMTSAFSQNKIKYFSSAPNYVPTYPLGGSRVGHLHRIWGDKPFYWVSPSGKDKVLHWATGTGYSLFHGWIFDKLSVCGLEPIWPILERMEIYEYPYPLTYMRYTIHGDNGPPDYDMPDVIRAWNEKYEYPRFHISTTKEVFEEFEKRYGDAIPAYSGDLSPLWEDGAASTANELTMNRSASERLNQAEILWSVMGGKPYPQEMLKEGWKYAILFSEHTWGASNSFYDPDSDFTKDLWAEKRSYAVAADSIADLLIANSIEDKKNINGDYIHVINTNSWIRTDLVTFESGKDLNYCVLVDEKGNSVPLQQLRNGKWAFVARDVMPLSSKVFKIEKSKNPGNMPFYVANDSVSNGLVSVKINATDGTITNLNFGADHYNYVSGKGLNGYIHAGKNLQNLVWDVKNVKLSVVEQGPVMVTLKVASDAEGCNSLVREITLVKDLERVDIRNIVDKKDIRDFENLRFYFQFNIPNSETNIDLGWASMFPERQQLRGVNKNFYNVLNQVGVMNTNRGIMLAMPDAPFIELENMTAETWRTETPGRTDWQLTSTPSSGMIYSWIMNNSWTTNYKASQPGISEFYYSISLFDPNKLAESKRKGVEAAQKMIVYPSFRNDVLQAPFEIAGTNQVVVSTIREVEGGLLIRLFNQADATTHFLMDWKKFQNSKKYICDNKGMAEREINEKDFWMKPYEVKSILVKK